MVIIPLEVSGFSVQITGSKGIPGYRDAADKTIIDASADSPVSINRNGHDYPMTCTTEGSTYSCHHEFEKSTLPAGEYVLLFTQQSGEPHTLTWPFIVDTEAPTITSFNIGVQEDKKLKLSYSVFDSASLGNSNTCSGIKKIALTSGDKVLSEKEISTHECTLSENNFTVDTQGLSGDVQFYLTVTDALGHSTTQSSNALSVDFVQPIIKGDVHVFASDKEITSVAQNQETALQVRVQLSVVEDNLQSVVADLRGFTQDPKLKQKYASQTLNCNKLSGTYLCKSNPIVLNPGSATVSIPVTATDASGNTATATLTKTFNLINKRATITGFQPPADHCDKSICFIKTPGINEFDLFVENADAGMDPRLLTIALGDLSTIPTAHFTTCNQTGSESSYMCKAYIPSTLPEGPAVDKRIVLTNPSTDLSGLTVTGVTHTTVRLDSIPPTIESELNFSIPGCVVAGEKGTFSVRASDDASTKLFIEANPQLITDKDHFENECAQEQDGTFTCDLQLSGFVSYPQDEQINISIRDLAGNTATIPYNFSVCEANNEYPPNFINGITTSSNFKVDRRVASLIPVKVYLPLQFSVSKGAEIIDLDATKCSASMDYLGDQPYIMGKTTDNPILVLPIGGSKELLPDSIPVNCTLDIYERRGGVRFLKPEEETLKYALGTTELSLGYPDQAALDKIVSVSKDLQDVDLDIRKKMAHSQFLYWLCQLDDLFTKVNAVVSAAKAVVYAISLVLNIWGDAGETLWDNTCPVFHKINKLLSKIYPTNLFTGAVNNFDAGNFVKGKFNSATGGGSNAAGGSNVDTSTASNQPKIGEKGKLSIGYFFKLGCMFMQCTQCSFNGAVSMIKLTVRAGKTLSTDSSEFETLSKEEVQQSKDAAKNAKEYKKKLNDLEKTKPDSIQYESGETDKYINAILDWDNKHANEDNDLTSELKKANEASAKSKWQVAGVPAQWDNFTRDYGEASSSEGKFIFSPYSSVLNARNCGCVSGIIYNQNKLKQLYCKEIRCLQSSINNGYPSMSECESVFASYKCLYYDGPLSRRSGFQKLRSQVQDFFANQFAEIAARPVNTALNVMCSFTGYVHKAGIGGTKKINLGSSLPDSSKQQKNVKKACQAQATGWLDVGCALKVAFLQASDVFQMIKNGFPKSQHDFVPETDYCKGLDSELGLLPNAESSKASLGEAGLTKLFKNVEKNTKYPDPEEIDWTS